MSLAQASLQQNGFIKKEFTTAGAVTSQFVVDKSVAAKSMVVSSCYDLSQNPANAYVSDCSAGFGFTINKDAADIGNKYVYYLY